MKGIKFAIAVIFMVFALSVALPESARAQSGIETPPAVVFTQDGSNSMLVNHNFKYDNGIFVPVDTQNDTGFYVNIPFRE